MPFRRAPTSDVVPEEKLKDVIEKLDAPALPASTRKFVDWVSAYTLAPQGAVLRMAMSVVEALEPPRPLMGLVRADSAPDPHLDDPGERRLTAARRRVLHQAAQPLSSGDLARRAGVGSSVVKAMVELGWLDPVELPRVAPPAPDGTVPGPDLSADQRDAADAMVASLDKGFSVTLLDGVTGSGKTEVYFEAVAAALRAGRQVLVLLPEIAMSAQWLARFTQRFGAPPAAWHSELPSHRRRATWRDIAEGRARVVVGARSALFLPYADLGLIVVDEEHEAAFKQEDGVIYHARDMAVVRARTGQIPIVLVSATPSLETVVNVEQGRYSVLHLPDRHGGAQLPAISHHRFAPRSAAAPRLALAGLARCRDADSGGGRAGDAVPQSPRLRAADPVPRLRPSPAMPELHRLAGRASPGRTAAMPSLRLFRAAAAQMPGLRGRKAASPPAVRASSAWRKRRGRCSPTRASRS